MVDLESLRAAVRAHEATGLVRSPSGGRSMTQELQLLIQEVVALPSRVRAQLNAAARAVRYEDDLSLQYAHLQPDDMTAVFASEALLDAALAKIESAGLVLGGGWTDAERAADEAEAAAAAAEAAARAEAEAAAAAEEAARQAEAEAVAAASADQSAENP